MWKLLSIINKQLINAVPVMMTLGFLYGMVMDPDHVYWLKNLILPLTFLMVYPMMAP